MSNSGSRRWPKVLGIVAAAVLVLLVLGVLALDRVLLSVARRETATLSKKLSRPITLEGVAVKLWGGLGVKIAGLSVGAAPGEGGKLLDLERAETPIEAYYRKLPQRDALVDPSLLELGVK